MKEVGQRAKGKGKRQKDEGRIKQTKGEGQEKTPDFIKDKERS